MSDTKPFIVLVPGSFALPEFYDGITSAVAARGYNIRALCLPSVGPSHGQSSRQGGGEQRKPATMYDDAAAIASEVTTLVSQGRDVIVVAHSYGGVPASESIKGLAKAERWEMRNEGEETVCGGIVRLAYVTALVPRVGASAIDVLGNIPPENRDELLTDEDGWMYHSNHAAAARLSFHDLPASEGEAWLKRFPRHSAASFATPLTYPGYKDVPISYLICAEDRVIPAPVQREGIEMIETESGRAVDVTVIPTGHIPMASAPEKVVDWILGLGEL